MMRRQSRLLMYGLPIAAMLAAGGAAHSIATSNRNVPDVLSLLRSAPSDAAAKPQAVPTKHWIGAAGIIEPAGKSVRIGTPVAGIVAEVFVQAGDQVARGEPLFRLDDRVARSVLDQRSREFESAELRLALARERRPALIALRDAARGALYAAEAELDEATDVMRIAGELQTTASMSERERTRRRNQMRVAEARVAEARAKLSEAEAELALYGEHGAGLALESATVNQAKAAVAHAKTALDVLTVLSPIDGRVLRVNLRPGEHARLSDADEPLVIVGDTTRLHLRADVDEADITAWHPGARARARVRAQSTAPLSLSYVRKEPMVVPKHDLTGGQSERVDTRVMQIIYAVDADDVELMPGQQLDVLIEISSENAIASADSNVSDSGLSAGSSRQQGRLEQE